MVSAPTRVRVLQTFTPDRGDISVNPYTSLLERSLRAHCDVHRFSWPRALAGRYDVLHCHWPEHLVGSDRFLRRTVAQLLLAVLLVVLRLRRIVVVETMHNVTPHTPPSRVSAWLLGRLAAAVDVRIYLHDTAQTDPRSVNHVFPHGDYAEWYAGQARHPATPGRLVYFGRIHRYKNVDGLLRAFAQIPGDDWRIVVAGAVQDAGLEREIRELASRDGRVELRLGALTDTELGAVITSAEAVVVPYEYLYNSGAMLLALTLGRPVIAPSSDLADGLAAEVGTEWVVTYKHPLEPASLTAALDTVRHSRRSGAPQFTDRDWHEQAARLVDVYRAAVRTRRG